MTLLCRIKDLITLYNIYIYEFLKQWRSNLIGSLQTRQNLPFGNQRETFLNHGIQNIKTYYVVHRGVKVKVGPIMLRSRSPPTPNISGLEPKRFVLGPTPSRYTTIKK